jgi:hypothetical protein
MGKFKEMDLLRQEREAFDADYPMEPTPRADMWIAWNSEDGFTFWDNEQQATKWSADTYLSEWPVQYVMQKYTPLSAFVRSSDEGKAEVMERVIDKAIEAQKKAQPAPVQEPDYAWPTVEDYEQDMGFEVNETFKMAWTMARTTNVFLKQLGESSSG